MGGRRRPFIMIGGLVSTLAFLALPYIQEISHITGITDIIIIASLIALFLDLSVNVTFNPARSIIADLTPEGKVRTAGFVWMQIVSGFFGVFAYFLSMVFGNEMLLYIAAFLVFATAVFPILFIEEKKDLEVEKSQSEEKFGIWQIVKEIFPLYGFLVFGVFSVFNHFFDVLTPFHNPVLIGALVYQS
jgi:Na+/melibiose symporter-like transporter